MQLTQSGSWGYSSVRNDAVGTRRSGGNLGWKAACVASIFPLAALLHHGVFYQTTCMLNPFGHDYTLQVISLWLANDPSLPVAVLMALMGYQLGNRYRGLRVLMIPFLIAFAPLAIWVWDIPFTARFVCMNWHDEAVMLADGMPLKGRHFYFLGAALYSVVIAGRLHGAALPWAESARSTAASGKLATARRPQRVTA